MNWTMPRDMSKFSSLEAELLSAICAVQLPEPTPEYRFVPPCCEHPKGRHRPEIARPPRHWYYSGPTPARCSACGPEQFLHAYDKGRRWRFDFAWPDRMVAVECEGGTWSGGRHTTGAGFEKDTEKYTEAALRGWVVLRFTQRQIHDGAALEAIERALATVAS